MKRIIGNAILFCLKAICVIVIIFGLYRVGEYAYDFGHQLYSGEAVSSPPGKDVAVVIQESSSVQNVADMLWRQGLIKDRLVFRVQEKLSKYSGQMQAGNYILNSSMSGEEMIAILSGHGEEYGTEME